MIVAVIKADVDQCMGYGNCVLTADDYFEADGMVTIIQATVAEGDLARVEEAVASCPMGALSLSAE